MKMFYNVANSLICCAKEERASIVLNIEWVQFVLQNCEKLHSVRCLYDEKTASKGLFTWSGGARSSGVGFFCFHALGDTKQKKLTPLDRGPPLHLNRV